MQSEKSGRRPARGKPADGHRPGAGDASGAADSGLLSLIHIYFQAGGFLVQFNIVSTETLRDAQLHPENHRDLVVRVATYAAYFIELGPELQEDIIHRLEMTSL